MKKLLLLILLISLNTTAQKKMVLISGFEVQDSVAEKTLRKFVYYMESNPINYEEDFRKIKKIKIVERDRYFVSDFKDGVIYLNSRLNRFPATKEIVILHHLAANSGMKTYRRSTPHVRNTRFNITERNEELFMRQLAGKSPYRFIVKELKEASPLRSKL